MEKQAVIEDGVLPAPRTLQRFHRASFAIPALIVGDLIALALAASVGVLLRLLLAGPFPIEFNLQSSAGVFICLGAIPFGLWLANLYPGTGLPAVERLRRRSLVTLSVFLVTIVFDYVVFEKSLSRGFMLTAFFATLIIPPLMDAFVRHQLRVFGAYAEPAVIIGLNDHAHALIDEMRIHPDIGYSPVAVLSDEPTLDGTFFNGLPVYAPFQRASFLASSVRSAFVTLQSEQQSPNEHRLLDLPFLNTILLPENLELQKLWVSTCEVGNATGLRIRNNLLRPLNFTIKRILDFSASAVLTLLTLPVVISAALLIKIISPGPALFRQVREGHHGKPIAIYKLRTMCLDAEERLASHLATNEEAAAEWARHFKLRKDPRLVPFIGAFLRESSIDELPQLWNVLEGKMSLVGPRPFPYYHLEKFSEDFRVLRRKVLPGITGMWQVTVRSEGDLAAQEQHDSYYIRNWSIWLDVYILALTVRAVVSRSGAR